MFEVTIEADPVLKTLDGMIERVDALYPQDIFVEFVAWQEDDMRRKYPSITPQEPDSVYTMIYPRSRLSDRRRRERGRFFRKRHARLRGPMRATGVASSRPILRSELFERLCERMRAMLDKIKWP
jgi:hypothetical protein